MNWAVLLVDVHYLNMPRFSLWGLAAADYQENGSDELLSLAFEELNCRKM